ncbi:condensation domain-containing protein [Nonomuraea fuscirosea]|uniref:condensation domain-containing protein n=1 Tax=Nonomuraea fuscirosea TaxID=1291556 RepID=UPI00344223B8
MREPIRLSPGQRDLVLNGLFEPGALPRLSLTYRISGPLDVDAFDVALRAVVAGHDALRLRFGAGPDGELRQWAENLPDPLVCQAVRAASEQQFDRYARKVFRADLEESWDLTEAPPLRAKLLRYSPELHVFGAALALTACDARSRNIFEADLWRAYRAAALGERVCVGTEGFLAAVSARRRPASADLPSGLPVRCQFDSTPVSALPAGHSLEIDLDDGELAVARRRCRELRCTLFQLLVGMFGHALFERSAQDRLMIALRVDTRRHGESGVMGMFTDPRLLVLDRAGFNVAGRVSQVRRAVVDVMSGHPPALDAVRENLLRHGQAAGVPPRLMLTVSHVNLAGAGEAGGPGLMVERGTHTPGFPSSTKGVALQLITSPNRVRLLIDADASVLPPDCLAELADRLRTLLTGAPAGPAARADVPDGMAQLTDVDGATLLVVDPAAIADVLRAHPAVREARVEVYAASQVRAEVVAAAPVTEGELREHCYQAARDHAYVVAPQVIKVVRAEDELVALLATAVPDAEPSGGFFACGGNFAAVRRVRDQAAARGLPVPAHEDFARALTLRGIADRAVARAGRENGD